MIKLTNITKTYDKTSTPVKDLNLEIAQGETVILKGESGCGKSTILSLIAALIRPTSGEISVDGRMIAKLPENFAALYRRENIGIIFQNYNLLPTLSVIENISVPMLPTNKPIKEIYSHAEEILASLDMIDKKDMNVTKLSGGEQQRTAIARALINNPKIILADEPTANLDSRLTDSLMGIFKKMSDDGKTLIIATHDNSVIESLPFSRVVELGKHKS